VKNPTKQYITRLKKAHFITQTSLYETTETMRPLKNDTNEKKNTIVTEEEEISILKFS
jgi:hypothetical protein